MVDDHTALPFSHDCVPHLNKLRSPQRQSWILFQAGTGNSAAVASHSHCPDHHNAASLQQHGSILLLCGRKAIDCGLLILI